MDIAKYIGLFLLKNNFVYLHGLGNLELKKKPASYDGDALHAPEYDVALTPGGSIDDNLANYIATHEQISISKAANALREFSTATRAELSAGKEVEIPGIGKFVEEQNGLVRFLANPHLKHVPPAVPMLRMSKRLEEAPDFRRESIDNSPGGEGNGVAWGRIALLGLLMVVIIGGIVLGFRYFNAPDAPVAADTVAAAFTQPAAPVMDTVQAAPPPPTGYTIVVNTYYTRAAAERRMGTLDKAGHHAEIVSRDSTSYLVTLRVPGPSADTVRMLDSLRRFFNPRGVYILK
jgi:nucleoid DNA-binding protein